MLIMGASPAPSAAPTVCSAQSGSRRLRKLVFTLRQDDAVVHVILRVLFASAWRPKGSKIQHLNANDPVLFAELLNWNMKTDYICNLICWEALVGFTAT